MKFKELEEGNKYMMKSQGYTIGPLLVREGLLWHVPIDFWLSVDQQEVFNAIFEPYVEYHTFEEARKWMKQGNLCKHGDEIIKSDMAKNEPQYIFENYGDWEECEFYDSYLEPKWILLDKED